MIRKHLVAGLTLATLALAVWGCSDAGPTAPGNAPVPTFAKATTVTGYASATDPALIQWYNSEKARVAAQAVIEQPVYDSLAKEAGPVARWTSLASKGGVAQCYPHPYAADVQIIGPEGGSLRIGPNSYTVPRQALSKYYVITGESHTATQVAVQFGPEGLGFSKQTLLQLSYAQCAFPAGATKTVVFTDNNWNIKEYEPSSDDLLAQLLSGYVVHFSQYAVAW